jgi:hypothetical protein
MSRYILFIHGLCHDSVGSPDFRYTERIVSNELVRFWEETVMTCSDLLVKYLSEEAEKTTKISIRIAGVPVEIQTKHFPNTNNSEALPP